MIDMLGVLLARITDPWAQRLDIAVSSRLGTVINSIQYGTITTSGTATITGVDTAKAHVRSLGYSVGGGSSNLPVFTLTNATTVTLTIAPGAAGAVSGFVVVEHK